jgi:hypothetical protein
MNRLVPLVWSLVGVSLCAFTAGLLLLPQRLLQRPLAEGVIAVHLGPPGKVGVTATNAESGSQALC